MHGYNDIAFRSSRCSEESRAHECILSLKELIIKLFDNVRKLEASPLPSTFADVYENMEDLSNCKYFQIPLSQMGSPNIKVQYLFIPYVLSMIDCFFRICITFIRTCSRSC